MLISFDLAFVLKLFVRLLLPEVGVLISFDLAFVLEPFACHLLAELGVFVGLDLAFVSKPFVILFYNTFARSNNRAPSAQETSKLRREVLGRWHGGMAFGYERLLSKTFSSRAVSFAVDGVCRIWSFGQPGILLGGSANKQLT